MAYFNLINFLKSHGCTRFKIVSGNLMCTCPFHTDRRPSFGVKVDQQGKGMYQCYGCQSVGSIYDLIKELNPYEVLIKDKIMEFAADSPLIRLEDKSHSESIKLTEDEYNQFAILHDYWLMRGISRETIKKFKLGYCPERWSVTIPVRSFDNYEIIGVVFRLIDTHPSFPLEEKIKLEVTNRRYDYLKGSKPSYTLFGVENIKREIRSVYLFEGPIDAMNFMQRNPDKQALAKWGGSSLSSFQIEYLKRFDTINIISDVDQNGSGQLISKNMAKVLRDNKMTVDIFRIDGYKDYSEAVVNNETNIRLVRI